MSNIEGVQIAIAGGMRSGKDTVGKYLVENYGFNRFAFGDGIVKTTKKLFPNEWLGEKPRTLLQEFGQYCVGLDKNVWVNFLFKEMLYHDIDPVTDNVVITDLRQPHEYEKLVESGFIIVRVVCDDEIRKNRIILAGETYDPVAFKHETEQHVRDFEVDFELDNNGTEEELIQQIENMILNITGGGN